MRPGAHHATPPRFGTDGTAHPREPPIHRRLASRLTVMPLTFTQKHLLRGVVSVVVVVLLVLYAGTINWSSAWHAIRSASPQLLIVAALANLATLTAKAAVWWIFLTPVGVPSFDLAFRATAAGAGLNNILIANSGDAARAVFVTRSSGAPGSSVLAALAVERLFDFLGYIVLVILAAFLLSMPAQVQRWREAAVGVLAALIVLFALLLRRAPATLATAAVPTSLLGRVHDHLRRFASSLFHIVTLPRLGAALLLTIVNWGTQIVSYHLTAEAAHFPITLTGSIAMVITSNLAFVVRATPGNVGVFQAIYALTAVALGLSRDAAVGVALLLQAIQNIPVTVIGAALAPNLVLSRRSAGADTNA
jgi:uncharacterized protein (TIRG00374 family)